MENKFIYTKSIKCVAYISHKTKEVADVVSSDVKGMSVFRFNESESTRQAYDEYKTIITKQGKMMVDLTEFDNYIKLYKRKCTIWNKQNS